MAAKAVSQRRSWGPALFDRERLHDLQAREDLRPPLLERGRGYAEHFVGLKLKLEEFAALPRTLLDPTRSLKDDSTLRLRVSVAFGSSSWITKSTAGVSWSWSCLCAAS